MQQKSKDVDKESLKKNQNITTTVKEEKSLNYSHSHNNGHDELEFGVMKKWVRDIDESDRHLIRQALSSHFLFKDKTLQIMYNSI